MPPLPDGEIVGPSEDVGHRLRDGGPLAPNVSHWERHGVVIVGGGIAGLAAAWRFRKAGFADYVLLELEKSPGGTSRSGDNAVASFPWGADYVPAPMAENRLLVALLDEMGVLDGRDADGEPIVGEPFLCRDPHERIFYKGRWYEGLYLHEGADKDDLAQLTAFNAEIDRWVAWRDGKGRRAFAIPMALRLRRCGSHGSRQDLDGGMVGAARLDLAAVCAGWWTMAAATITAPRWKTRVHGRACSTSPRACASRERKRQPLITWPEGNGRIVAHLYQQIREHVRLGLAAAEIMPTDPNGHVGVDVIAVDYAGKSVLGIHAGSGRLRRSAVLDALSLAALPRTAAGRTSRHSSTVPGWWPT